MKMMKNIAKWAGIGAVAVAASSVQASPINVGGVVWDPDQAFSFPSLADFFGAGGLVETSTTGVPGDVVYGGGIFERINSQPSNVSSFCPGCELTFTFSMELVAVTPTAATSADFEFTNLVVDLFVDHTPDYNGTFASAADGVLWLSALGHGNLTGSGEDIGTGSDNGDGSALLDVVGGLAFSNFDTNSQVDGADAVFSSSFQPITGGQGLLSGTFEVTADTIPAPGTIALLGLGLLGLGSRKYLNK